MPIANVTKPNEFTNGPGNYADANQVNQNYDTIYAKVNEIINKLHNSLDGQSGADETNATPVATGFGSTIQSNMEAIYAALLAAVLEQMLPPDLIPESQMAPEMKKQAGGVAPYDSLATKANLLSPQFTGMPLAPTPSSDANDTRIATAAFVKTALVKTPVIYNLGMNTLIHDDLGSTKNVSVSPQMDIEAGTYLVYWRFQITPESGSGNINASSQYMYYGISQDSPWNPTMIGSNNINIDTTIAMISGCAVVDLPAYTNAKFCVWNGPHLKTLNATDNIITLLKLD